MTVNYTEKSYDDILKDMVSYAQKNNLLSDSVDFEEMIANGDDIENTYVMLLSAYAQIISNEYRDLTKISESFDIDKAVDEDLDNIGALFDVNRPEAQHSVAGLTFYLDSIRDSSLTIPQGTVVSTERGEEYVTQEDAIILANTEKTDVLATSTTTGSSTRVGKETIVKIISNVVDGGNDLKVTNPQQSTGGKDQATNEEYRELIKEWKEIATAGTQSAFEYYFRNLEGIDAYRLIPHWDGAGTLKIIIDTPTNTFSIMEAKIKEDLKYVGLYADDDIVIEEPASVLVSKIKCAINVDIDEISLFSQVEKDEIVQKVENAISTYVDGGYRTSGKYYSGLTIGEDFVPWKCGIFVSEEVSEVKNIVFASDEPIFVGNYEKATLIGGDLVVYSE